ncbi:MAG: response regulator transcription factor [Clostridia bacterium]|nr:response regulator transcription factor [Oscillospiraceae bacterium]MBQ1955985.1 response regulator transcription factor [Clostridia bacterium]
MAQKKMLIAEDDVNIQELLKMYMTKEGFDVETASNGGEALVKFRVSNPDIVLLDIMMPGLDGWEVCHSIRKESNVPVIMLTARGETADKVNGLELGADDYIVKPFEMTEVVARVNAVLRRYSPAEPVAENDNCLIMDKLVINMESYQLTVDGEQMDIPPKEIELLYFLAKNANRVYTRDQLLDQVWGFEYFGDTRTVDVHVKRLREKLKNVSEKWALKTVWGVGYKFEVK